jgi:ribosomal protein L6P/L9E
MKLLHSTREVVVPEGLSLEVKARQVRVKGPRGEHIRSQHWPRALTRPAMSWSESVMHQTGGCIG